MLGFSSVCGFACLYRMTYLNCITLIYWQWCIYVKRRSQLRPARQREHRNWDGEHNGEPRIRGDACAGQQGLRRPRCLLPFGLPGNVADLFRGGGGQRAGLRSGPSAQEIILMMNSPNQPSDVVPLVSGFCVGGWLEGKRVAKDTFDIRCVQLKMSRGLEPALREREVQQLLKLEELFHSHYLTEELLNDMISLYVRFAESLQGNITRHYFMEKIRFVLSRPEVIKGLEKDRESGREPEPRRIEEKRHVVHGQRKAGEGEEKSGKIELQMQVMKEVEEGMNAFRAGLGRETVIRQQKETEINQLVSEQDQALAERRANRKKKLRKKSANLNDVEVVLEAAPPIPLAELKQVQKELEQTYIRFTRLTQNKMKKEESQKPNKGRVRFQIQEHADEDEEFFDQLNADTKQQPAQKENAPPPPPKPEPLPAAQPRETTTVEYKTFDQKKGRVTVRNNQYEEIDEEEF